MNDSIEIKVSPEILNAKAQEVTGEIGQMKQLFSDIQDYVKKTQFYWIGEAGNLHRKMFEEKKEDIDTMIKRLEDHPRNLQQIAGVYEETESAQTDQSNVMSSNLID